MIIILRLCIHLTDLWSRAVGITFGPRAEQPWNRGSINQRVLFSLKRPNRLWGPLPLIFSSYRAFVLQGLSSQGKKQPTHRNACSYTSTVPYAFTACTGTAAPDIIIIIIIISYMQGICTYIPETNHVPSEYSVETIP